MAANSNSAGTTWLYFALLTVVSWGVYGIFLHTGSMGMQDKVDGRMKAFLIVGVAYFLTAVLAPMALLAAKGASIAFWKYPPAGFWWSLIAGTVGAIGALGVLLAFGAKGNPAEVMAIVFAGAPVVNALVALWLARADIDWSHINPLFYVGIVLALAGGGLVTLYKPNPHPPAKAAAAAAEAVKSVTPPATPAGK